MCSCKFYAWIFEVPVVETDNFVDPGGNKRSCSTVCTAFTIKMFLVIIAEHISLIDCGN